MEYNKELYKKIAGLRVNKIVKVSNSKGWVTTIKIQNITELNWQHLQLLVSGSGNRFEKMWSLYQRYVEDDSLGYSKPDSSTLTLVESKEINEYITIFKSNEFAEHFQVNKYITDRELWDGFKTIRSLNDHGVNKEVPGIQPKYFNIICSLLGIQGGAGSPLIGYKKY